MHLAISFVAARRDRVSSAAQVTTIVAFATAWGPKHGGINAFNADLLNALSSHIRNAQIICVILGGQIDPTIAPVDGVRIVRVPAGENMELSVGQLHEIENSLTSGKVQPTSVVWVGHDLATGFQARAAQRKLGGVCALIKHASYTDYSGVKHLDPHVASQKEALQRSLFTQADVAFGIGPLLTHRLKDMVSPTKVHNLVPGISKFDTHPTQGRLSAVAFGRLDEDNDRVKQGHLAVHAFARAVRHAKTLPGLADGLFDNPVIKLIGIDADPTVTKKLLTEAEDEAERVVDIRLLPFLDGRDELITQLGSANVSLFLSWHDGFGLSAWEAIGAGIPLIISRATGVYKMLEQIGGRATGCVTPLDIRGSFGFSDGNNFRDADADAVCNALIQVAMDLPAKLKDAQNLRTLLLNEGLTWSATAEAFTRGISSTDDVEHRPTSIRRTPVGHLSDPALPVVEPAERLIKSLSIPERIVLVALVSAARPLHVKDLGLDFAPGLALDEIEAICAALLSRSILCIDNGLLTVPPDQKAGLLPAFARLIAAELVSGEFVLVCGFRLRTLSSVRQLPVPEQDLLSAIAGLLQLEYGARSSLESALLNLLADLSNDHSSLPANVLTLIGYVRGHLSDLLLPACSLLSPDFRAVTAANLDIGKCKLVRPRFTSNLRNISATAFGRLRHTLLIGDSVGNIALFEWPNSFLIWRVPLHTQWVRGIVCATKSSRAFSCGEDGRICSFSLTGDATTSIEIGKACWNLTFSADEERLAVAADDGQVHILAVNSDAPRLMCRLGEDPIRAIAWHATYSAFVTGGDAGVLHLVNPQTAEAREFARIGDGVRSLCVLECGSLLVGGQRGTMWRLSAEGGITSELCFHSAEVRALVPTTPGRYISASRDGRIAFWLDNNDVPAAVVKGFDGGVRCAAYNGDELAFGTENRALITLAADGQILGEITGVLNETWATYVSADQEVLVGSETGALLVFRDIQSIEKPSTLHAHERRIRSIAISSDGGRMVTGSSDRTVRLWVRADRRWTLDQQLPAHLTWLRALCFYESRWAIIGAGDGRLRVWDCAKRTWNSEVAVHEKDIQGITAFPKAQRIVSIGKDRKVAVSSFDRALQVRDRKILPAVPWSMTADSERRICYIGLDTGQLFALQSFSELVVIEGTRDGAALTSLVCVESGDRIVAASSDGFLTSYKLEGTRIVGSAVVHAHLGGCNCIATLSGGEYLISTGTDGSIGLWSVTDLRLIKRFHTCLPYERMVFDPTGFPLALLTDLESLGAVRVDLT